LYFSQTDFTAEAQRAQSKIIYFFAVERTAKKKVSSPSMAKWQQVAFARPMRLDFWP